VELLGYVEFADGVERAVYQSDGRQFVFDDSGEMVYGEWIIEHDETPSPVIVHDPRLVDF
jgi:hypothetical protein